MNTADDFLDGITPYAMWTDDCQGKQDFNGPIISIRTRYWPSRTPSFYRKPSAYSMIVINTGPREGDDSGGTSPIWSENQFEADTEAEVKAQVEAWVTSEMKQIIAKLLS